MTNNFLPHLHILPEDDADRAFANGFLLDERVLQRNIQVLKPAGGWRKVVASISACGLEKFPERRLLLLLDFDDDFANRLPEVLASVPEQWRERVFVLGAASTPEKLKLAMALPLEEIGQQVAQQCADDKQDLWQHAMLVHNLPELGRLFQQVRDIVIQK